MAKVNIKPAHTALGDLIEDLEKKNLKSLKPKNPANTSLSQSGDSWLEALKRTQLDLEQWCGPDKPGDAFFIDVPPAE